MKMKVYGATFATLDLVVQMIAEQRTFNKILLQLMTESDEEYAYYIGVINSDVRKETELIRAKILQYSDISIDDLLNGTVDI